MADAPLGTQEVSIWNKDENKAVTVTTTGSTERLDVDANIRLAPEPYGNTTPIHVYAYDADSDIGDVEATYTVTAGKNFYIYGWGISDNSYGTYELQIDGTTKDAFLSESSSAGARGLNQTNYTVPIKATAGQVVRIYKSAGLSNKKVAAMFYGFEV